jgi:hypothetical protein
MSSWRVLSITRPWLAASRSATAARVGLGVRDGLVALLVGGEDEEAERRQDGDQDEAEEADAEVGEPLDQRFGLSRRGARRVGAAARLP